MNLRTIAIASALFAVAGLAYGLPADAAGRDSGETKVFTDVTVVRGETIDGDVNVVFGDATIEGVVTGDCNAIFGQCSVVDGGVVRGRINCFNNDGLRAFLPWTSGPNRSFAAIAEQDQRLVSKLLGSAIVILVFLLFPLRMRVALSRVERHPALSAATGVIATIALIPIFLVLLVSIIGIPLIAIEVIAVLAGIWIGTGAIALLVGRRLAELVMPATTPSPLVALILGLVVVSAAEIVPLIGWAVTLLVWLVGFGSAILAFIRSAHLDAAVHRTPLAGPAGGPPAWR